MTTSRSRLVALLDRLRQHLDDRASSARAATVIVAIVIAGLVSVPVVGVHGLGAATLVAIVAGAFAAPIGVVGFVWGAMLPIEVLHGAPEWSLDVVRYSVAAVLAVRVAPTGRIWVRPWRLWASLLGGLAVVLAAMGAVNDSRTEVKVGLIMLAALVVALVLLMRYRLHRPILLGFAGGVLLSAVVIVMQVAGLPTLQPGLPDELRYPGLATQTSTVTWQLAMAVVIAGWMVLRRPPSFGPTWFAYLVIPVCSLALLVCGAQGGMFGLLVAAAVIGPSVVRSMSRSQLRFAGLVTVALFLLAVGAALVWKVDGIPPKKGFVNEIVRWDVARSGLRSLVEHPVTGVAARTFRARYGVLPHTVPIEAGVVAGVLGFGVALAVVWQLVRLVLRGRGSADPLALLASMMAAVIFANTLVEAGSFIGLSRITLVLLAVGAGNALPYRVDTESTSIAAPTAIQPCDRGACGGEAFT